MDIRDLLGVRESSQNFHLYITLSYNLVTLLTRTTKHFLKYKINRQHLTQ